MIWLMFMGPCDQNILQPWEDTKKAPVDLSKN